MRALCAGAFALLLATAFPFRAGELRFDVGIVTGWLALVPFAWMLRGLRPFSAFGWAAAAGTLAYTGILFWIFVVVHVHGHAPEWAGVAAVILLAAYVGLHVGAAGAAVAWLQPRVGGLAPAVLPAAWVCAEFLRSFELGFPWAYLGYSAHANGPIAELSSLGGVWGLSFLLAAFASLAAEGRRIAAVVLLAAAHAAGFTLPLLTLSGDAQQADAEPIYVGVVQGNIPQDQKWDPARARGAFEAHLQVSRLTASAGRVDLVVWPEASVPYLVEHEPSARAAVRALAAEIGAPLLLGGVAREATGDGTRWFNSAYLVTGGEGIVRRYDKSRLVPFGEYVPLRSVLGWLSGLATGMASGDLTRGNGPRAWEVPGLGADHALGPLICYEVIYPDLVRGSVRQGARVLVNITNDAWYGRTSAPDQFLAIATMRSVENARPMVRAANTGISAIVDQRGVVTQSTPIFERRGLRAAVPAAPSRLTPYTRWGDWIVWLSAIGLVALAGLALSTARTRKEEP